MRQLFPPLVIYGTARLASKSLAIQPGALGMEGVGSLCCGPSTVLVTGHWSLVTGHRCLVCLVVQEKCRKEERVRMAGAGGCGFLSVSASMTAESYQYSHTTDSCSVCQAPAAMLDT